MQPLTQTPISGMRERIKAVKPAQNCICTVAAGWMESAAHNYTKQEQAMVSWHLIVQPYQNFHKFTFETKGSPGHN